MKMAQRKSLNVNGKSVQIMIDDPDMPLLYALRDNLALHGARFGEERLWSGLSGAGES
jgi:nicotinate dehydrogenase subunit A